MISEEAKPKQTKALVLHVKVPDIYADDIEELAGYLSEPKPPGPEDLLDVVLDMQRSDVGITIVTLPGDKCQNHEFEVFGFSGEVVGVEVVDR